MIAAGKVEVNNGIITDPTQQVHENNHISLAGQRLTPRPPRYIMLHKPAGYLCSHRDGVYPSIFQWLTIDKAEQLHLVGRLDADTTGLILLTDDGRWSYHLTHPANGCSKVYRVTLRNPVRHDTGQRFNQGLLLQGETRATLPAQLHIVTPTEVLLTLTEGRFHQVKRMFAAVGNKVVTLHREQISHLCLDVSLGEWRYLTTAEIANNQFA